MAIYVNGDHSVDTDFVNTPRRISRSRGGKFLQKNYHRIQDVYEAYFRINGSAKDNVIEGGRSIHVKGARYFSVSDYMRETINGFGGNDVLFGRGGNDVLRGGSGNDVLDGGDGHDHLFGNQNDDVFLISVGNDTLDGGAGSDTAVFTAHRGYDYNYLQDVVLGLLGWEEDKRSSVLFKRGGTFPGVFSPINVSRASSSSLSASLTVPPNFSHLQSTQTLRSIEKIIATIGNDNIAGNNISETFWGLEGNDILKGHNGNDTLVGGDGKDQLWGEEHNDVLYGDAGTDILNGGNGEDVLFTGSLLEGEKDDLTGGNGRDTFFLGDYSGKPETVIVRPNIWSSVTKLGLSLAGDVSDLLFTTFWPGFKLTKEVVPMLFDVVKEITGGEQITKTTTATPPPAAAYAHVKDFNPLEDVILIPITDTNEEEVRIQESGVRREIEWGFKPQPISGNL